MIFFCKLNIFAIQKCSFQKHSPDKSRENDKKTQLWAAHIINNFNSLS